MLRRTLVAIALAIGSVGVSAQQTPSQATGQRAILINNVRIWFMNTYSVISAGALSLRQSIRGEGVLQVSLILLMCLFSLIGLLTSLRLKAELEECLAKLQAMAAQAQVIGFLALGQSEGDLARYPKFRWIFPVFYSMATAGFVVLLVYGLATGEPTRQA